jgi:hypothetical protein
LKHGYVVLTLLAAVFIFGCKRSSESVPRGAYAYKSYDSSGSALVNGWLTIVTADSATVSGEWHFDAIGTPERIGPQTGDGKLVGGINGAKVWIELNPSVRNNNLQLNGTLVRDRLSGQWTWISYDGIRNQGTFEAVR